MKYKDLSELSISDLDIIRNMLDKSYKRVDGCVHTVCGNRCPTKNETKQLEYYRKKIDLVYSEISKRIKEYGIDVNY